MSILDIREEYKKNRYLENLTLTELEKRAVDIFSNSVILDRNCKISPLPLEKGGAYWMAAFDDVVQEFKLRNGKFPAGFDNGFLKSAPVPDPSTKIAKSSANLLKITESSTSNTFYKLGQKVHISDLYNFGKLRICPASLYDDPSLSSAIRDDELTMHIYPAECPLPLRNYTPPISDIPGKVIHSIEAKTPTNYYVFCVSSKFSARLPTDFCADAVLEIVDVISFSKLLTQNVLKILDSWKFGLSAITYIDPIIPHIKNPVALFSKHFRFTYQNEVRYVWLPPAPEEVLPIINIEMGSLKGICKMHSLET